MTRRLWMSTLNITAITVLLVAIAAYLYIQPRFQARPTGYAQTILQDDTVDELVSARPWLVVQQLNPSPVFGDNQQRLALDAQQIEIDLPKDEAQRIQAILQTLKSKMDVQSVCGNAVNCVESIWPDGLGIPEVFVSDFGNNRSTVVLNFPLASDVNLSVQQETALKASIEETLNRNKINNSLWLINDEAQPLFIKHIALKSDLD